MRIGFITQLLWPRYGQLWVHLIEGIGGEAVFASPEKVKEILQAKSMLGIPGTFLQLATAQAMALSDVDVLVVPKLNVQEVPRGSGQDPWIADFPTTLANFGNFPRVLAISASLENVESIAIEHMLSLSREASKVKLVWERNSHRARAVRYPEISWTKRPYQNEVVAVIGQPWMMTKEVLSLLSRPESLLVSQGQFEPKLLKQEAPKQKRLIDTDAEVLGAAHFFSRKGNVDKILMIADHGSGADVWLEKQVKQMVNKPLEVVYLQDLISPEKIVETLLVRI